MSADRKCSTVPNAKACSEARAQLDAVARALLDGDHLRAMRLARKASEQLRALELATTSDSTELASEVEP